MSDAKTRLLRWIAPLLIVLLTFTAFSPVLQNGFVDWDDDRNILENPSYRGLGWTQLRWMFTTFHMSLYRPLTWVMLGLDYLLWGMMTSVILYGLSLLSKAGGVTLPVILLVLDVYPLGRVRGGPGRFDLEAHLERWFGAEARRVWWEKTPFLLLALGAGMSASIAQYQTGAMIPLDQYGVAPRIAQAFFGLVFYLWKTVVPLSLSPFCSSGSECQASFIDTSKQSLLG